jgi:hypothetical protein
MGTVVEDLLRLAWQAAANGHPNTRNALLTLAVAESGTDDAVLGERCRRVLVAIRPGHWFDTPAPLTQMLDRPRVASGLADLRAMFPPVRVRHLLLRCAAQRGPCAGRPPSVNQLLRDLTPSAARPSPTLPRPVPAEPAFALPFPAASPADPASPASADPAVVALYLSVLLAMAALLQSVIAPASRDSKAA